MVTFVFVHGAWFSGWCWDQPVVLLEQAGYRALAPDLLGTGSDRLPLAAVTFDQWVDQIVALIERQLEPVVLVGHSRGGMIISAVAERVPHRVARLVYLAAVLLRSAESVLPYVTDVTDSYPDAYRVQADGMMTIEPAAARAMMLNETAATAADAALARLNPEPASVVAQTLALSDARYGSVPRAYIECRHDRSIPLATQRAMGERSPCQPVLTLEADHSPFLSDVPALVAALISLVPAPAPAPPNA